MGDLIKPVFITDAESPEKQQIFEYTYDANRNVIKIVGADSRYNVKKKTTYDIEYQLFDLPIGITDAEYEEWLQKLIEVQI